MRRVFSELGPEELCGLEVALKKVGKRAAGPSGADIGKGNYPRGKLVESVGGF